MRLIDTNVILRYVLEDNEELFEEAEKIIDQGGFAVPEVIAEVVYVLTKVYGIEKPDVCSTLRDLMDDIEITGSDSANEVMLEAISIYEQRALDFVDCILIARNHILGDEVLSFDEKLNKQLQ